MGLFSFSLGVVNNALAGYQRYKMYAKSNSGESKKSSLPIEFLKNYAEDIGKDVFQNVSKNIIKGFVPIRKIKAEIGRNKKIMSERISLYGPKTKLFFLKPWAKIVGIKKALENDYYLNRAIYYKHNRKKSRRNFNKTEIGKSIKRIQKSFNKRLDKNNLYQAIINLKKSNYKQSLENILKTKSLRKLAPSRFWNINKFKPEKILPGIKIGFSRSGKYLGKALKSNTIGDLLTLIPDTVSIIKDAKQGKDWKRKLSSTIGGIAGGTLVSAALSAAGVGLAATGVGAIPGAILLIAGNVIGTMAGEKLGEFLYDGGKGAYNKTVSKVKGVYNYAVSTAKWLKDANNRRILAIGTAAALKINPSTKMAGYIFDGFLRKKLKPDGKHSTGLSYVPYDGYLAELHKGERVITASENRAYGKKTRNSNVSAAQASGNIFNITINGVNKSTNEIINDLVVKISEAVNTMGEVAV